MGSTFVEPGLPPGPDDIAIIGYSFKLPQGVNDDADFWEVLQTRRNLMTAWPDSRMNAESFASNKYHQLRGKGGHFITEDVRGFDAPFFSVNAKEAAAMDPIQRWTLEAAYHAFEKAGILVENLRGSRTAVYSASMLEDYSRRMAMDPENAERTAVTGNTVACMIPNRVSWYFDLRGPSIHVNTACSSSLAAVDMACKTLRSGDASCALVTGANILLDPAVFQVLSSQNFISPDSLCYSFDHRANGYARGEGIIAVVLKPVEAAVRDGDMIRAVIRSTGSNQDGRTPVVTQPSPQAQEDLIRHVYKQAGLSFEETCYVEAHGTGTPVGDPIEMKAIGRVFRKHRSLEQPLYVGSVKANIGHLEGASALASIVKSILILEKGIIPPNALFEKINPAIDLEFYHCEIPTQNLVWPNRGLRRISVNSFGFGGSNSHVVLDDALHYLEAHGLIGNHCTVSISDATIKELSSAQGTVKANGVSTNTIVHTNAAAQTNGVDGGADGFAETPKAIHGAAKLLVWTAADEKAVKRTTQSYELFRDSVSSNAAKMDRLAFTLAARRSQMLWRTFAVVTDLLEDQVNMKLSTAKPTRSSTEVGLAFVFTGQGAQYAGMGWDLVQYPVFANTLKSIDVIYSSLGCEWSIFDELRNGENVDKPEYSQPLSTAVQIALVELLWSFGIIPKAVVGHSSGEIAAAYTIGALSLQSACKVAFFRGQLAGKLRKMNSAAPGAMISINLAEHEVPDYLEKIKQADVIVTAGVCVACVNSPLNCTLSGPETAMDMIKAQADKDGIFAQKLKTGVAYHSPAMLAVVEEYLSLTGSLEGADTDDSKAQHMIPMVSSVSGKAVRPAALVAPQYWMDNMVSPVRFADAIRILIQESSSLKIGLGYITDLVEIGPHPALRRPVQDTIRHTNSRRKQARYASALHRSQSAVQTTLELVGQLFCLGHAVKVSAANEQPPDRRSSFLVDCPAYPFDRSHHYWSESRISRDFRLRDLVHGETLGVRVSDWNPLEPRWRNFLSIESSPWIAHHKISDTVLYPASGMLVMAIEAAQQMAPNSRAVAGYLIRSADFINPILVFETREDRVETEVHLQPVRTRQAGSEKLNEFHITIFSYIRGQWTECFRARIQIDFQEDSAAEDRQLADQAIRERYKQAMESCRRPVDAHVLYHDAAENGLQYGDWFQLLQEVHWDGKANATAQVDVSKSRYQTSSLVHPAVLDQAFHVLRVSAGQQSAANVPVHLSDAWIASSAWQQPHTKSIRWLASSTSASLGTDVIAYGEEGNLVALADDDTILCSIKQAITVPVTRASKERQKTLLYSIEWKPQLSLLDSQQLARACDVHNVTKDETSILTNHALLCSCLSIVAARTLGSVDPAKVPEGLRRHVEWMEHHVSNMTTLQRDEADSISDAEVEARLCAVEHALPAWKLYTTCARNLPDILAGTIDPLQVVFESDQANVFYADLFKTLCADGRLGTVLDMASHENPALRILEVGAGTGGMTGHVLAALGEREKRTGAPSFAEYTFTDISPVFFERARSRWPELEEQGRLTFKTLDLDREIGLQGFDPGSYDLVIAASVLHATPYLEATIRNVRSALKKQGHLVLMEVINPNDIATNFMAGLVPGWWVAREEWRPHSAAVPESLWDRCLKANGFSGNDLIIRDYEHDECHIMSVIVSTAQAVEPETSELSRLVFIVDEHRSEEQIQLARLVQMQLDPEGHYDASICAFSSDQVPQIMASLGKDDIVICVAEVGNRALLSTLSRTQLPLLQCIIEQAAKLLWATATTTNSGQYPDYSIVQGFMRSLRAEQPSSHLVTLAIEGDEGMESCATFISRTLRASFGSPAGREVEYIVRDGLLMTGRAIKNVVGELQIQSLLSPQLRQKTWGQGLSLRLWTGAVSDSENATDAIQFVQDAMHDADLGTHEVEIETHAWGLSYQDVQNLQHQSQGSGCVGVVTRVGSGCNRSMCPGDRVCMLAADCMRRHPRADVSRVFKVPEGLSDEAVISVLVPGLTAYHALVEVAHIQNEDRILVHAAVSSMGQMALQIAKMRGADVFATVSSSEERDLLLSTFDIAENHVLRNSDAAFHPAVEQATKGYGFDIIFNDSKLEDEALEAFCDSLATCGRFLEVGQENTEADRTLPMQLFAKSATFSVVDATHFSNKIISKASGEMMQLLLDGKIQQPEPLHVFNASEINEACKQLQDSSTVSHVVITPKPDDEVPQFIRENRPWDFDGNASYLIAGGTGGLGRAIMKWMADRGARYLIVPSRSGANSEAAAEVMAELTARGVHVIAPKCDVSDGTSLASMLSECARAMPPIRGCINAAMVLQDAVFQNMSFAQWDLTMRSKVQTSWNLHRLLPGSLDFFILLSSLAGVAGQMASANYAAGCSFQDALARFRLAKGQKALSIDIGWMRNIGIIAETGSYQRQRQKADDMQPIDDTELLALLTLCCDPTNPAPVPPEAQGQVLFGLRTPVDVRAEGREPPTLLDRPLFAAFSFRAAGARTDGSASKLDQEAAMVARFQKSTDSGERVDIVVRALAAKLARAMTMSPDDVESSKPLSSYGVDSLMAVELRNWIKKEFSAHLAVFDIMGGVPISKIAELIVERSTAGKDSA